jgi:ferredoxin-NADP reductase/Na+-translocating ferredoxin:NAD+ oxidoreductase RnfD subunit
MDLIDDFLRARTTSRLVLVGLTWLAVVSIAEAFFGTLPYTAIELLISVLLLLFAAGATNAACVLLTNAKSTFESSYITALLLFFILSPIQSGRDAGVLMAAAALAILSKYVFSVQKMHIFNPAAFGALMLRWAVPSLGAWWVATPFLFPFVAILGLLVLRKLRRFEMVTAFIITAAVSLIARAVILEITGQVNPLAILTNSIPAVIAFIISTQIVFFAALLLTDPQTSPDTRKARNIYGVIIGIVYAIPFSFLSITATPLLALLVGNIYAYLVGKRKRFALSLQRTQNLSKDIREYTFAPSLPVHFRAGQYIELTLPHKSADARGVRRAFSISSAPSDPQLKITTTLEVEGSTFKDTLQVVGKNSEVAATGPRGHFTFPRDPNQKLLCIASGVGIAPFMSFFRELAHRHERRDSMLIYSATSPLDFVYADEMDSFSESIGLKIMYLPLDFTELSRWNGPSGPLTPSFITKHIRDYASRCWFIAGPQLVVEEYAFIAASLAISKKSIKTEPFPGF